MMAGQSRMPSPIMREAWTRSLLSMLRDLRRLEDSVGVDELEVLDVYVADPGACSATASS